MLLSPNHANQFQWIFIKSTRVIVMKWIFREDTNVGINKIKDLSAENHIFFILQCEKIDVKGWKLARSIRCYLNCAIIPDSRALRRQVGTHRMDRRFWVIRPSPDLFSPWFAPLIDLIDFARATSLLMRVNVNATVGPPRDTLKSAVQSSC